MRFKPNGIGYLEFDIELGKEVSEISGNTKEALLNFFESKVVLHHGATIDDVDVIAPSDSRGGFEYAVCVSVAETRFIIGWLDQPLEDTPVAHWRAEGKKDPHDDKYLCARNELCMGNLTDDELANEVFLYDHRTGLNSMSYLTAAKERIRWLSRKLAAAEQQLREATDPRGIDDSHKKFEIEAKDNPWTRFDEKEGCDE